MINAKLIVSQNYSPADGAPVSRSAQTFQTNTVPAPVHSIEEAPVTCTGYSQATVRLARDLADNHGILKDLLKTIRVVCASPNKNFVYDMSAKTAEEQERILNIVRRMQVLIADLSFSKERCQIQGRIADIPSVIAFLSGRYLEVAVAEKTREIVARYASQRGFDYAVTPNVIITTGTFRNELDLLIEVNNVRFAIEVKSGDCKDYEKYYDLSYNHGLLPDHFMVVGANVSSETVEMAYDFYQYFVCDLDFEDTLLHMLRKGCGKENIYEK